MICSRARLPVSLALTAVEAFPVDAIEFEEERPASPIRMNERVRTICAQAADTNASLLPFAPGEELLVLKVLQRSAQVQTDGWGVGETAVGQRGLFRLSDVAKQFRSQSSFLTIPPRLETDDDDYDTFLEHTYSRTDTSDEEVLPGPDA